MNLWLKYALIETVAFVLFFVGLFVVGFCAYFKYWEFNTAAQRWDWCGGRWTKLWGNNEDGIFGKGPHTPWQAFYWCALRNSVNNLRFVRGVSNPKGPYLRWVWMQLVPIKWFSLTIRGRSIPLIPIGWGRRPFYWHMGFAPTEGWPVMSGGSVS